MKKEYCQVLHYNNFNLPVISSSSIELAGPIAITVSEPLGICVRPASTTILTGSDDDIAWVSNSVRVWESGAFTTTFACPLLSHDSILQELFADLESVALTAACATWAAIFPLPIFRDWFTMQINFNSSVGQFWNVFCGGGDVSWCNNERIPIFLPSRIHYEYLSVFMRIQCLGI